MILEVSNIIYRNETINENIDRNIRKMLIKLFQTGFNNQSELDTIYDDHIKVRTSMAHKLGYPSYVELAYDNLQEQL